MAQLHISLVAEKLFDIGPISVSNSIFTTWLVMGVIFILSFLATSNISLVPGKLQSIAEILIDGLYSLFHSILHERTKLFFPLIASLFIFIIALNWSGLLPGVGTIGIRKHVVGEAVVERGNHSVTGEVKKNGKEEFIPMFRAGTADLNTTLSLAIIVMLMIQISGFKTLGLSYLKKFFNFSNPIYFFVGILELVSEFSKILSFSFRLFGNIFAGEVLLAVMAFLMPLFAPVPFLGMELFVGFIQALVFSMLTTVFLSLAVSKAEH